MVCAPLCVCVFFFFHFLLFQYFVYEVPKQVCYTFKLFVCISTIIKTSIRVFVSACVKQTLVNIYLYFIVL